jgi:membrane-anchored protein YejM (alkaline phosphatase superfamily)
MKDKACIVGVGATGFQLWRLLALLTFFNAIASTVVVLLVVPTEVWLASFKTAVFLPAALTGHFTLLFLLVSLVLMLAYLLRLRGKAWLGLGIGLCSVLLIVIIIDARVYALYRFHLNAMTMNLIFGGAAGDVLSFSWQMWIGSFAFGAGVLGAQIVLGLWLFRQQSFSGRGVWPGLLLLMVSTQLYYGFREAVGDSPVVAQIRYIPWAQPLTMKSKLHKWGLIDTISKAPSLSLHHQSTVNYPLSPLKCDIDNKPNVLVLMMDSVRADMFNAEVMPHTVRFAESALVYNNHWSTSNSTRFGLFGFFYGIPSTYWFDMYNEQRGAVLFDVLKDQGYDFHLDAAAPLNSPEFDRTVFSVVRDKLQWGKQGSEDEIDTTVINRLLAFLESDHTQPFFAFSFLDAPHSFKLPSGEKPHFQPAIEKVNYLNLNNDYDAEPFLNLYKSTVHYNDRLFGRVYQSLRDTGLLQNTIVIVTSDHGQEFNELKQNYWGHNSNFASYQVGVPLVIHWPGKDAEEIDHLTSHQDIVPTILREAFNCSNDVTDYSAGLSLFDEQAIKKKRYLLLANWSMKAIYTGEGFYHFPNVGDMEVLDTRYRPVEDPEIDYGIIRHTLLNMKRYLK